MEERNFDLASFKRAKMGMVAINETTYNGSSWNTYCSLNKIKEYTPEEIQRIIESGSLVEQQKLSRNYFYKDGYYKQIIIHYATLLQYAGLLIPNPALGKNLSTPHISKRYYNALDFVENINIKGLCINWAQKALVDGTYYGIISKISNKELIIIDLPTAYCCSRFKDEFGHDIIEFNLQYFDSIADKNKQESALAAYPEFIEKAYRKWHSGKRKEGPWIFIPSTSGICLPFFDGRPLLLSVIPKTIDYDKAVEAERERDAEEIRKIIVQKIPHLADGRLLFEPDEAEEFHAAAVGMLKGNKNINVLTTYADVEAIGSKTSSENPNTILDRIEKNIYSQGGTTSEIFNPSGPSGTQYSLDNDLGMMMYFANKVSTVMTSIINDQFANSNINFKYSILPVAYYNQSKFIDNSFKLVGSGYSFLLPPLALGLSQRDLTNVKDLENGLLKLTEKLKPLETSYTKGNSSGSGNGQVGRPAKDIGDKAATTITTEESRTATSGGN